MPPQRKDQVALNQDLRFYRSHDAQNFTGLITTKVSGLAEVISGAGGGEKTPREPTKLGEGDFRDMLGLAAVPRGGDDSPPLVR